MFSPTNMQKQNTNVCSEKYESLNSLSVKNLVSLLSYYTKDKLRFSVVNVLKTTHTHKHTGCSPAPEASPVGAIRVSLPVLEERRALDLLDAGAEASRPQA